MSKSIGRRESSSPAGRLDFTAFGRGLLETNDLDPVYVVLWEALSAGSLSQAQLLDWLLAYWCYYHVGTASWIVNQPSYWDAMVRAAGSKEYPRAHERRHFRGKAAIESIAFLQGIGRSGVWNPIRTMAFRKSVPLDEVMRHVTSWKWFGPWIAFKAADMLERLGIVKVDFTNAGRFMFESPRKGAELLWSLGGRSGGQGAPPNGLVDWAVNHVLSSLGGVLAPPGYDRYLNVQEAETVLCKYHTYYHGNYVVGEDILAVRRGLAWAGRCKVSQALFTGGRSGGLW